MKVINFRHYSLDGFGAISSNQFFHALFPSFIKENQLHITGNCLELLVIVIATKIWGRKLKGKQILPLFGPTLPTRILQIILPKHHKHHRPYLQFLHHPNHLNNLQPYIPLKSVDSIRNYISAIKLLHLYLDLEYPQFEYFHFELVLKGLSRLNLHCPNQAQLITPYMLLLSSTHYAFHQM
jgi:hypothetical protein